MRQAFAHEAVLTMDQDGDIRAPGAAITVALCGHTDHEPPCPVAPHFIGADRVGGEVHLRILFSVEPEREGAVRQAIDGALAGGRQAGPDGAVTRWRLDTTTSSAVSEDEADHAARLARC